MLKRQHESAIVGAESVQKGTRVALHRRGALSDAVALVEHQRHVDRGVTGAQSEGDLLFNTVVDDDEVTRPSPIQVFRAWAWEAVPKQRVSVKISVLSDAGTVDSYHCDFGQQTIAIILIDDGFRGKSKRL